MERSELEGGTVIARDATLRGEMECGGSATVLGTVVGTIRGAGEVRISEGATAEAEVAASKVLIDGTVRGDVSATERMELSGTARVSGDISAKALTVAEGASFSGRCRVGEVIEDEARRVPEVLSEAKTDVERADERVDGGVLNGRINGSRPLLERGA